MIRFSFFVKLSIFLIFCLPVLANSSIDDPSRSFVLPTLTQNTKGEPVMYWLEKDDNKVNYLYFSISKDGGKTFDDKKLIIQDANLGNSRLMRPKLLFKKDGSIVAVFSYRSWSAVPQAQAQAGGHGNHANHKESSHTSKPQPKNSSQIMYSISKDNGNTWSASASVDTDTTKLVRGFADAVVLPNDEIAVVYLKDVKGSTKHEERDLRMALTKNGVFQQEKLLDPVVCDCCGLNLLIDSKGHLNVFYRDNNDDIRDIARLVSADNGQTFSKSEILHNDKWQIQGCPHTGPNSVATRSDAYVTWFSGTENTKSGVRLVNSAGKLLKVLDSSAKNSHLAADANKAVMVWEQLESGASNVFYTKINEEKTSENQIVKESINGQNASVLLVNGKTLIAYEHAPKGSKSSLRYLFVD
jgi:hypothetical protein